VAPEEPPGANYEAEIDQAWRFSRQSAVEACARMARILSGPDAESLAAKRKALPTSWSWILGFLEMWPADYVAIHGPIVMFHPKIIGGLHALAALSGHADRHVRETARRELRRFTQALIRKPNSAAFNRDERAATLHSIHGLPYREIVRMLGFGDDPAGRSAARAAVKRGRRRLTKRGVCVDPPEPVEIGSVFPIGEIWAKDKDYRPADKKKFESDLRQARRLIQKRPDDSTFQKDAGVAAMALYNLSTDSDERERHARDSIEAFGAYLARQPEDDDAARSFLFLLQETGRLNEAFEFLRERLRRSPEDAKALRAIASIHFQRDEFAAASEALETLINFGGSKGAICRAIAQLACQRLVSLPAEQLDRRWEIVAVGIRSAERALAVSADDPVALSILQVLWRDRAEIETDAHIRAFAADQAESYARRFAAAMQRLGDESQRSKTT
jgi:tetratricopeptide (TPR) repeat protein